MRPTSMRLLAAVTERTRVVYLANPNNPTGTLASKDEVARLYAGLPKDVLFVIDQAYSEYLTEAEDDGGLELAKTQPNVFITRTFSKIHGLAAERIGWGYACAEVISALHRIRLPFNVTRAGQAAAIAAIGDEEFVTASREHNAKWRSWLAAELESLGNHGAARRAVGVQFPARAVRGRCERRDGVQPADGGGLYRPLAAGAGIARRAADDDRHRGRDARAGGGDPRGAERLIVPRRVERLAIIGLGLIGSSIARAVKERLPDVMVTGHDASGDVRDIARTLGLCDAVIDDAAGAVADADLVILAVPVGGMAAAALRSSCINYLS